MTRTNPLFQAPPYHVQQALKKLGQNLRQARVRRNLSIEDVAAKIGTGRKVVADAERVKPSRSFSGSATLSICPSRS